MYLKVETPKSLPWHELHPNYVHLSVIQSHPPSGLCKSLNNLAYKQTDIHQKEWHEQRNNRTQERNGMNRSECCTRKTMTKLPKRHKHSEQWGMMAGQKVWPHHGFFGPNVAHNDSNVFIIIATAISFPSHRFLRIWQNKNLAIFPLFYLPIIVVSWGFDKTNLAIFPLFHLPIIVVPLSFSA